ncbi:hypothetical protein ABEF95_010111 [Exophiala dermatitidis]
MAKKASANANATAPLRRSNRIAKQPSARTSGPSTATGNGSPKVLRPLKPKNELDGLMIKIYAEIHDAAINPIASADQDEIHSVLRKARTIRFLKLLPKKKRDDVLDALDKFKSTSTRRVGRVYQDAMDIIKVSPPSTSTLKDRLQSFPTLLLLSICSHSSSFRAALADSNLKNPTWKNIVDRLKMPAVSSSLELFARTRGLEWQRALAASDSDLGVFLKSILRDFDFKPDGITASNFGINANVDLKEVHPNADDSSPYHWVLPLDNKMEAVRCVIEYTVTSDLVRDGFTTANGQGNAATGTTAAPSIKVGDLQSAHQLNISQTILLPNYDWKNLAAEADGDPRFCGYKDNHCEVCGSEYSLVSSSGCDCSFADLCSRAGYADSVLVELMTTERTGTGVLALQDIRDKQFLGEYIGEIYPVKRDTAKKNGLGQAIIARYGGSAGHSYMLEVEIVKASDTAVSDGGNSPAKRRRTTRATGAKGAKTGNRVSKAAKAPAASPSSGGGNKLGGKMGGKRAQSSRPAFVIDSAVRGNWTRYINHSCRPNTRFETVNLGHRRVVLVKAMRRIDYDEELTIDYGDSYFTAFDYGCKCGYGSCRYWREGVGAMPDHVTLKMAVDQKIAPQWAMNDKNVPIVDGKSQKGNGKGSGKGTGNAAAAAAPKGRTTRSTTAAAKAAKGAKSGIP